MEFISTIVPSHSIMPGYPATEQDRLVGPLAHEIFLLGLAIQDKKSHEETLKQWASLRDMWSRYLAAGSAARRAAKETAAPSRSRLYIVRPGVSHE